MPTGSARDPAPQLTFDLAPTPSYAPEDYVAGDANAAARLIAAELLWPTPVGLIVGEPGSGKTHLAHVAVDELGDAVWLEPDQHAGVDLSGDPALLIIDGVERWIGPKEDSVFHALEAARGACVPAFVTARKPPENLGFRRPDTVSRLRAGLRAEIGQPDDRLFTAIAIKLFTDRQLMVDPVIASYLFQRMERSYSNLSRLIGLIDERSLSAGRSITKSLARDVLTAFEQSSS